MAEYKCRIIQISKKLNRFSKSVYENKLNKVIYFYRFSIGENYESNHDF